MFDIGWSELLLVGVLALVFVGPKDLPRVMRTAGKYVGKMRAMAREFQQSFEDLARESELEELRKQVAELRNQSIAPLEDLRQSVETPVAAPAPLAEAPAAERPAEDLAAHLPDDITPDLVEAIREAGEIEKFDEQAQPAPKSEAGRT
ncbi:twin-arginine translocase subunit TatB [Parvibaculum sedimenti]|uniref:Sec-independent protein translocase protein TatB n=1 Tax=Parvibaculum sedimenti TaxID=2608632 RepID=A0A6N6VFM6_9HYPH|nr:Sec-independent protein translocase protein TatB [Parvibaculum sedimenti]KAB7739635.1 twin-arginine translocase subunit TatB [Parvibaculum sedimenti]